MPRISSTHYVVGLATALVIVQFVVIPALVSSPETLATEPEVSQEVLDNPFDTIALTAAAAYVVDTKSGRVLYSKNATAELPLASLTKLMTTLVAQEELGDETIVTITPEALLPEGDHGLLVGEQFWSRDLIDLTLLASSNDGAYALASAVHSVTGGVRAPSDIMNERAHELGLEHMRFANATGLDVADETLGGAYGSAENVAKLFRYIITRHPDLIAATRNSTLSIESLNGIPHHFENTNIIAESIPWLIGSKTGFTDLAGGNLAIAFDVGVGHPIVAVILGSTKDERFTDMQKIIDTTFDYFATSTLSLDTGA